MNNTSKDLLIAIDGNALVHRAFHAFPPTLSTSSGLQVNAVYGFSSMLLQMLKQFDPKYVFCAFDTGKKTFRHTKYVDYKAHRKALDESLIAQFPLVEEVLKAFNIPIIKKDGYEADDLLGTVAKWGSEGKWSSHNLNVYILTGDRDLLQTIAKNVFVVLPDGSFKNLVVHNRDSAYAKYGYYPEQVTDYKAIVGDASDNIPGVKGVGEKTVIGLLKTYGNLQNIYEHLADIPSRYALKLQEGVEQAMFSKDLATIDTNVSFDLKLEDCLLKDFNRNTLVDLFTQFEFRSLISKIPQSIDGENERKKVSAQLDFFSINNDSTSETPKSTNKVEMITWNEFVEASKDCKRAVLGYVRPEDSNDGKSRLVTTIVDNSGNLRINQIDLKLKNVLAGITCETYFVNYEDFISDFGCVANFDTLDLSLLAYTISSGNKGYSFSDLAFNYLSLDFPVKINESDVVPLGQMQNRLVDAVLSKAKEVEFTEYTKYWMHKFLSEVSITSKNPLIDVVKYIVMRVSNVVALMENKGIKMDIDVLRSLKKELAEKISNTEKAIYESIGHEVNINSPKQLSEVLYKELKLPTEGNGKNKFSTREEILEGLKTYHPAISFILEYRELSKVQNTYVIPLLEIVENNSGVVHTDFKQTGSSSGRFSSVNPNLQNIPLGGIWGEKIRSAFIAREGYKFVGADYSQMEFRVMADISQDEALMDDFVNSRDIHRSTAARILNKEQSEVTKQERSLGKTINFGILFGQTPYGLSKMLGIDQKVAAAYIDEYFKHYSGVAKYIEGAKKQAYEKGWVQSMLGRTRYISGLRSRVWALKEAAAREAVNMPIQGGEADLVQLAMIKSQNLIDRKYKDRVSMLLQIHDELVFEVKNENVEDFMEDISALLKNVIELKVPLDVNVCKGDNLAQLK